MAAPEGTDLPAPSLIRFADCELDLAGYEIRRSGRRCAVEPQVFELLAYLVRNAGRLVTKDELITQVWGGRIVSDSALSGQIKSARQAIGDDGEQQRLIRTVHGRGFRFVGELTHGEQPQGEEPRSVEQRMLALPDKPSIAVLPFANLSGDPEQDYFADGIVEDITTALSRIHAFFVIARNSAFAYKGKAIDVKQVGRELGVRYLLEGSVRRADGRVRITGQLIDAETGVHVWADKYDSVLEDVFDLQDRVTASVAGAIEPSITRAEIERTRRKPPESLQAYDFLLQAIEASQVVTQERFDLALQLARRAVALDPRYALACSTVAMIQCVRWTNDWTTDPQDMRAEGERNSHLSVQLAPDDPTVLTNAGLALTVLNSDPESAIVWLDRAIALNPSSAYALGVGAQARNLVGDYATAADHAARAMRLSPFDPMSYRFGLALGVSRLFRRALPEAVTWLRRATQQNPGHPTAFMYLASAHAHLGRLDEARAAMARLLEIRPTSGLARAQRMRMHKIPADLAYLNEGARMAGLPD